MLLMVKTIIDVANRKV
jgi:hypothetical protein